MKEWLMNSRPVIRSRLDVLRWRFLLFVFATGEPQPAAGEGRGDQS
jgi:hypothetical protein